MIKGSRYGDWSVAADGTVTSGGIALQDGEFALELWSTPAATSRGATAVLPSGGYVVLDTTRTPELEAEGLARDVVAPCNRPVGTPGWTSRPDPADRVGRGRSGRPSSAHQQLVMAETLAVQFGSSGNLETLPAGDGVVEATAGDGLAVRVKVERVATA